MASIGIRQLASGRWQVYWRLDDGSQGGETLDDEDQAEAYRNRTRVEWDRGTWHDPKLGRVRFGQWADEWWATWSAQPDLSPHSLDNVERVLRLHVRPAFDRLQLRAIGPQAVQRWQSELATRRGRDTVMAARSILYRALQAAENEGHIATNPMRKVRAPKRPVNPEARFGRARRRTMTPEEFGRFLAAAPPWSRDHFLTQAGTGLRPGELLGLRVRRVDLTAGHLEVLEVRYEAGQFGTGYKDRPKSGASIRPVPLAPAVAAVLRRRIDAAPDLDALVLPGPGGSNGVPAGAGVGMAIGNYRRVFKATVDLAELADAAHDLRGPHDLRRTFATWLEDAAIPSRVIDELMGHESGGAGSDTSRMGALYRETTPVMLARVTAAIEERLILAQAIADGLLTEMRKRRIARYRKSGRRKRPQAG
jgi:integrase